MAEDEKFEASRAMRRAMLGAEYVDAQTSDPNPVMREFSDYLTSMAWGVWTRGGALSTRDRSLVVLAMTAALGRMDEFRLHVSARSRTGVTDDELDELLFQMRPTAARRRGSPPGGRCWPCAPKSRAKAEHGDASVSSASATWAASWRAISSGAGHDVVSHDVAGPERNPDGAAFVDDVAQLAGRADVVVLSLPDGAVSEQVAGEIAGAPERRVTAVVDTSTIGVAAARAIDGSPDARPASATSTRRCPAGSPGRGRGRCRSCTPARTRACRAVEPVLAGLSDRRRRVGDRPGMAQALKLANNFLSATALAATSEAIAFGLSVGLDMATMLEVIDGSSGQSAATSDKFPNHVLTGRYGAGFANSLMAKDLQALPRRGGGAGCAVGAGTGDRVGVGALCRLKSRGPTSPGSTRSWPDE